jgi:hypothetical protein
VQKHWDKYLTHYTASNCRAITGKCIERTWMEEAKEAIMTISDIISQQFPGRTVENLKKPVKIVNLQAEV